MLDCALVMVGHYKLSYLKFVFDRRASYMAAQSSQKGHLSPTSQCNWSMLSRRVLQSRLIGFIGPLLRCCQKCVQVADLVLELRKCPHRVRFSLRHVARRIVEVKHSRLKQGFRSSSDRRSL